MDLVSVVIPTHNRSNLVLNSINSVLNQTYTNIEIIVIDDASTDDTEINIKSLENEAIKYLKVEKSRGGNYARNLGIEKANGNYIAFLDDDDEWLPEKVEDQLNLFINDNEIGLVYTGANVIYSNKGYQYIRHPKHKGDLSKEILIKNYIGTTSSVMLKKSVIDSVGGFDNDMPALQDYDLWIRVAQYTKIDYIDKPLIKYYNHDNTDQITDNVHKIEDAIKKIDYKYEQLISQLDKNIQSRRYYQRYNGFGKRKLRIGEKKEARKYFLHSFKVKPNLTSIKFLIISIVKYDFLVRIRSLLK